jgi:hypothetical protein
MIRKRNKTHASTRYSTASPTPKNSMQHTSRKTCTVTPTPECKAALSCKAAHAHASKAGRTHSDALLIVHAEQVEHSCLCAGISTTCSLKQVAMTATYTWKACNRTNLYGSWSPESKLRTFNTKLDQEGPAQTSWCSEWAVPVSKPSSMQ